MKGLSMFVVVEVGCVEEGALLSQWFCCLMLIFVVMGQTSQEPKILFLDLPLQEAG